MVFRLDTQADLKKGVAHLVALDERFAPIVAITGVPGLRRRETGFPGIVAIVCAQQLSTASANAIWERLRAAFDPITPAAIAKARTDRLARLGLSAAKIKTLKSLAREIVASRFDLDALADEDAEIAHAKLTALHGIGPWTADVYLLFCLGHPDAWPAGDLAVQEAVKLGLGLPIRPTTKEMMVLAEPWRPWRGVAAHVWWTYYKAVKQREGVLAAAPAAKAGRRQTARANA
jgi:DNA-3-methyladenine glycosylase II